jgi:general stress protein YciG
LCPAGARSAGPQTTAEHAVVALDPHSADQMSRRDGSATAQGEGSEAHDSSLLLAATRRGGIARLNNGGFGVDVLCLMFCNPN